MKRDPAGFLRPVQTADLSTALDDRIAGICPGLGQSLDQGEAPHRDPVWGPWHEMRTGWSTDEDLRHRASSGGALSAILEHLLLAGDVDAVVQIAADPDDPLGNRTVVSRTPEEVRSAAGSRYAPSAPLADLEPLLEEGHRCAFVGKPCDVAALRALARTDSRIDRTFPVMVSFFCGGVPSGHGARALLSAMGVEREDLETFRYRGHGWPGRATATLRDGGARDMSYHESWGNVLSRYVQLRCKICPDGTGKTADIVCADAWETDDRGYPLFEDAEGVSLIVTRTAIGERIVGDATAAGRLATGGFDPDRLPRLQPGQFNRHRALAARLFGLRLLGRPVPRFRGLHVLAAGLRNSPWINLRNMMGTIRRARKRG